MKRYKIVLCKLIAPVIIACISQKVEAQTFYIEDITIERDGTGIITINATTPNVMHGLGGYITLPDGFEFVSDEHLLWDDGELVNKETFTWYEIDQVKKYTEIISSIHESNRAKFAIVNTYTNDPFLSTNGPIFMVSIKAPNSYGEYAGTFTPDVSVKEGNDKYAGGDVSFKITVGGEGPSFGNLFASVSQDKKIPINGLSVLNLSYPDHDTRYGFNHFCSLSLASTDSSVKLFDSNGNIIEEVSVRNTDGTGTVNFISKLKRGENYRVSVPKGLYKLTDDNSGYAWDSPKSQLTYTTDYILGDVDDDQKHSITDVVGIASYILNGSTSVGELVVDCNPDGNVNTTDITSLVHKVLTGSFPATGANARERAMAMSSLHPQLNMTNTDNSLAISLDNSGDYNAMQFDVALTDDFGNDMTSADDIMIQANNGIHGHNISMGIVDGKLRVLVYSLANTPFDSDDIITLKINNNNCTATLTNAVLSTTDFVSIYPDDVEARLGVVTGIKEITNSESNTEIYDLNGRKLNSEPMHGVVIVNGVKVLK